MSDLSTSSDFEPWMSDYDAIAALFRELDEYVWPQDNGKFFQCVIDGPVARQRRRGSRRLSANTGRIQQIERRSGIMIVRNRGGLSDRVFHCP